MTDCPNACRQALCDSLRGPLETLLTREWLITNGTGGFAGGTVIGCPCRRYHGLLIAPKDLPLERRVLLAATLDRVVCGERTHEFSTFEFPGAFHPAGYRSLVMFEQDTGAAQPWVKFTFADDGIEFIKEVSLYRGTSAVRIRYEVSGPEGEQLVLAISPLLAMRDFHSLTYESAVDPLRIEAQDGGLWSEDTSAPETSFAMFATPGPGLAPFEAQPSWWHNFRYSKELKRGYPGGEDLLSAGTFRATGGGSVAVELVGVGYAESVEHARRIIERVPAGDAVRSVFLPGSRDDPVYAELIRAANQFVVRRGDPAGATRATVLAGYHWFGDWGRDTFISLEGLLLVPGWFDEAREVLETFAGVQRNGLIPNRFNDYGDECAYNSVDASLWFIHAADAYTRRSGDENAWTSFLERACWGVVDAFLRGTDFDIRVDERGLLHCGNPQTQLTWMDAKVNGIPVTPRHGFAVEINALWYSALRLLTDRAKNAPRERLVDLIEKVERNFEAVFWNERDGCLYDCVREGEVDAAVRPNQILAVSLPYSALDEAKRRAVLEKVRADLLTPYGLRSLSPADSRYRGTYEGDEAARDSAYHNGTVWAWLIGPFVEAHLRVKGTSPEAKRRGREFLAPLLEHLSREACLGSISEIFDGDAPHHSRGCVAQAWSVAEVLRAYDLSRAK